MSGSYSAFGGSAGSSNRQEFRRTEAGERRAASRIRLANSLPAGDLSAIFADWQFPASVGRVVATADAWPHKGGGWQLRPFCWFALTSRQPIENFWPSHSSEVPELHFDFSARLARAAIFLSWIRSERVIFPDLTRDISCPIFEVRFFRAMQLRDAEHRLCQVHFKKGCSLPRRSRTSSLNSCVFVVPGPFVFTYLPREVLFFCCSIFLSMQSWIGP